ncbi:hypothetical protein C8T65DRAFT_746432 [Cerioporus squamosus]|nr:hypothetical protein C8T65DRAFT_746432 [Cerioporus squamosus]
MPERHMLSYTAIVRKAAEGVGDNPDTYMLVEKPAVLISAGIRLKLYTYDSPTFTHLAWVMVERARAVEKNYVEFIVRRAETDEGELGGDCHFLVVERRLTAAGWSMRNLAPRMRALWTNLTKKTEQIPRFLPPTPPPASPALTLPTAEATASSMTADLTTNSERSVESLRMSLITGEHGLDTEEPRLGIEETPRSEQSSRPQGLLVG